VRKNHPALEQKCPKLIDHRRAPAGQAITDPVDNEHGPRFTIICIFALHFTFATHQYDHKGDYVPFNTLLRLR
jgi:hypothetical protein